MLQLLTQVYLSSMLRLTHTHTHTHAHTHTCMHARMHAQMHTTHTYMHTCMHAHSHTTHTHSHHTSQTHTPHGYTQSHTHAHTPHGHTHSLRHERERETNSERENKLCVELQQVYFHMSLIKVSVCWSVVCYAHVILSKHHSCWCFGPDTELWFTPIIKQWSGLALRLAWLNCLANNCARGAG